MLSRVADAVYWMCRYIERAENIARFIDVNEALTLDLPGDRVRQWRPLVASTGDDDEFSERYDGFQRSNVMRFLIFDERYRSSIYACVTAARENARSIREIISSDVWEQINLAYHFVRKASVRPDAIVDDPEAFLKNIKAACYRVHGSADVTMTHNDAWNFMQLGRMLERADKTSRILDVKYFLLQRTPGSRGNGIYQTEDDLQWAALLQSVSALEMYRRRCGLLDPNKVVDFLLFDAKFPRSIRFCVQRAERSLHRLAVSGSENPRNEAERRMGRLRSELEFGRVDEVLDEGLHAWVDRFQKRLNASSAAIHDTFFALGSTPSMQVQNQA